MTENELNAIRKKKECLDAKLEKADKLLTSISEAKDLLQSITDNGFCLKDFAYTTAGENSDHQSKLYALVPHKIVHSYDANWQPDFMASVTQAVQDVLVAQLNKSIAQWQAEFDAL